LSYLSLLLVNFATRVRICEKGALIHVEQIAAYVPREDSMRKRWVLGGRVVTAVVVPVGWATMFGANIAQAVAVHYQQCNYYHLSPHIRAQV
jgi:hypothetical protein